MRGRCLSSGPRGGRARAPHSVSELRFRQGRQAIARTGLPSAVAYIWAPPAGAPPTASLHLRVSEPAPGSASISRPLSSAAGIQLYGAPAPSVEAKAAPTHLVTFSKRPRTASRCLRKGARGPSAEGPLACAQSIGHGFATVSSEAVEPMNPTSARCCRSHGSESAGAPNPQRPQPAPWTRCRTGSDRPA